MCFLAFQTIMVGQSTNWEKSTLPALVSIKARFQTSIGYIIGYHQDTKEWFITQSNGQDWSHLPLPITDDLPVNFKEDKDGFVYCAHQNILYRLILNKILVTNYYTTDSVTNEDILDYSFQTNGDFMVATKTRAKLLSDVFVVKKVLNWPALDAVKFIESTDGVKYIVRRMNGSSTITSISKDLVLSATSYPISEFEGAFVQNSRIFTRRSFSDNGGLSWNQYAFANEVALFCTGLGTKVFYATNTDLFVSKNNGTDFSKINQPETMDFLSANKADALLMSGNSCEKPLYSSGNDGNTWALIQSKQDLDYHYDAILDHNSNLLLNSCSKLYTKGSSINDWTVLAAPNVSNVIALSNGSLLGVDASDKFKVSFNNGQSWNFLNTTTNALPQGVLCEKNKLLINVNADFLQYSSDFGLTWNVVDNFISNFGLLDFGVGTNFVIAYFDQQGNISEFDLISKKKRKLGTIPQFGCRPVLEISSRTGSYFSICNRTDALEVYRSTDAGKTFNIVSKITGNIIYSDKWKIITDPYGNLVVYSDQTVYLSTNDGTTFQNITPANQNNFFIKWLRFSPDHYLYLGTNSSKVYKYKMVLNRLKTIKLQVFADYDRNCTRDPQEPAFGSVKYTLDKGLFAETDTNGHAYLQFSNDVSVLDFDSGTSTYTFCSPTYLLDYAKLADSTVLTVPVLIEKYCVDLQSSISSPFVRRCFGSQLFGRVKNLGTIASTDTEIWLRLDSSVTILGASLPIILSAGNILVLDAGTIAARSSLNYEVRFVVSCTSPLGALICFNHEVRKPTQICGAAEKEKEQCFVNIGSYDPNDKTLFVNGKPSGSSFEIADRLEYQIRFQNTGNDTAFHVRIEDPISSKFNISSLRPTVASHAFRWKIENRKLIVDFDNIMLVDSFKNEPLSHGFVNFSIELDAGVKMGDVVENQAYIYFDFNDPILTNNAVSKIASKVNVVDLPQFVLLLAPNPTNGMVYVVNPALLSQEGLLTVYDNYGKSVLREPLSSNLGIDLSQQPAGVFVFVIQTRDNRYVGKLVKQ